MNRLRETKTWLVRAVGTVTEVIVELSFRELLRPVLALDHIR